VFEKLKLEDGKIDWDRVYKALEGYERSRYGGKATRLEDNGEVLRLSRILNGRRKWWTI
jgi:hypothetical protein